MADSVKIKITGDAKPFNEEMQSLGKTAKNAVSGAGSVFKGIMGSKLVTAGVSALTNGLKGAINTGMQFSAAMSQVAAISGATGEELTLLTETAKRYGETTMFSATQAAEALSYMALAGWDANQSVAALGGVLDLAAASGMDLGRASDVVTDYLSAFGMEASQAGYMADLMAYAQSRSNTSAAQLADAYGNAASTMHAAGQDIETTTALLMSLANQGIKGSEAGTQLSAMMRDLTQKMDKGKIMIGQTAVTVQDASGNFRDLNDILADVDKATAGMGSAEKSAALMETFSARSIKAINTILNEGVTSVNAYEEALRGSEGTAAEQAKTMMDNLQGDVKIFQSALEGVQITAAETMDDAARAIVQEGTAVLEAVNAGGKAGGLGGMADALIDQIPELVPKATKGVEKLLGGVGKRLPSLVSGLFKSLPSMLSGAGSLAPILIDSLTGAAGAAVEGLIANLPNFVGSIATALPGVLASAFKGVGSILGGIAMGVGTAGLDREFKKYQSLGTISGTVDVDATLDYAAAQKEIDDQLGEFVEYLKGKGLTTEQVAQVLAFKGTQEELDAWLTANFPSLDDAAKAAIKAKFTITGEGGLASLFGEGEKYGLTAEDVAGILLGTDLTEASVQEYLEANFPDLDAAAKNAIVAALPEGGLGASLVSQLQGMGISNEDIVTIITAQAEGDTTTIESLLTEKYSGIQDQARAAIEAAWNAGGVVSSGADQTSTGFIAQLIVSMFTDGVTESEADITAAIETAKGVIERKKAELQALIDSGVLSESELAEAEEAISQLNNFGSEVDAYVVDYANATTETCRVAGENLTTIAAQVDSTLEHVLSKHQELQSFQGRLFTQGVGGAQLTAEDMGHAFSFIKNQLDQEIADAGAAKEAAIKAGQQYDEVNETYLAAVEASQKRARARIAALAAGQVSGQEGVGGVTALASIWDQLLGDDGGLGSVNTADVERMLREKGFDGDVLNEALMLVMTGPNGILNLEGLGDFKGTEGLAALNLTEEVSSLIAEIISEGFSDPAVFANELQGMEGVSNELLNQILLTMFGTGGEVQLPDVDSLLSNIDFGTAGRLIQAAAEQGLIEGVSSEQASDAQFMQQLIGSIVGEGNTSETVEIQPDVEADISTVTVNGAEAIGQEVDAQAASGNDGSQLSSSTTTAVSGAISAGTSAASGASAIGTAIGDGLAQGIKSKVTTIASAAADAVREALEAAKSAADAHSPSRKMMELGKWFDEGFAIGIADNASLAINEAVKLSRQAAGAVNTRPLIDLSTISGTVDGALRDIADIESVRPVVLEVNGRELARTTAADTAIEQNAYNRRVAVAYGQGGRL